MPTSYNEVYFPVLLQGLIAMTIAGALLLGSFLLGKKVRNRVKDMYVAYTDFNGGLRESWVDG